MRSWIVQVVAKNGLPMCYVSIDEVPKSGCLVVLWHLFELYLCYTLCLNIYTISPSLKGKAFGTMVNFASSDEQPFCWKGVVLLA